APVKYQQTCDAYPGGQQPGNANYCSPRRIAGCAPVAWAMLASAHKRHELALASAHRADHTGQAMRLLVLNCESAMDLSSRPDLVPSYDPAGRHAQSAAG